MLHEIEIPGEVPVMTLGNAVLFPQAMLPLYIFEPRYRLMLDEVLKHDRIFAVAARDDTMAADEHSEPAHAIAGIGIIRACQKNIDGTSNLILQGIARVRFESIVSEDPYRRARICQIASEFTGTPDKIQAIKPNIISLVKTQIRLGAHIPREVVQFLENMNEPEGILDMAIFTLCDSGALKQTLLETRDVLDRHRIFQAFMHAEIAQLQLDRKLKGDLDDQDIGNN